MMTFYMTYYKNGQVEMARKPPDPSKCVLEKKVLMEATKERPRPYILERWKEK